MEESHQSDSLSNDRLKYPQYTKRKSIRATLFKVLVSGHHGNIEKYRELMALKTTIAKRPV